MGQKRIRLACVDSIVPGNTLTEKAQNLKKYGFEGIVYYPNLADWNEEKLAEMRTLQERTGIHVCEFSFGDPLAGCLMSNDSDLAMQALELHKKVIEICAETDAWPVIVYEFGRRRDVPSFQVTPYPVIPQEDRKRFVDIVRELNDYAKRFGLHIIIEAANRYEATYVNRQECTISLLDEIGDDRAGLLCDLFHMSMDEDNLIETLYTCKGKIRHVHAADTNRRVPGYGFMDWKRVIEVLCEIDYAGYLALECSLPGPGDKVLPVCREMLQGLIDTYTERM